MLHLIGEGYLEHPEARDVREQGHERRRRARARRVARDCDESLFLEHEQQRLQRLVGVAAARALWRRHHALRARGEHPSWHVGTRHES